MATQLQPFFIDGQMIWVEVEPTQSVARGPGSGDTVKTASGVDGAVDALERVDLRKTLAAIVAPVHQALAAVRPEEVSVELTLGLKGEVGVFVAKSEGSASLKITAKWKFPPDAKQPAPDIAAAKLG